MQLRKKLRRLNTEIRCSLASLRHASRLSRRVVSLRCMCCRVARSAAEPEVEIHVRPDGSYKVYGPVRLLDVDGNGYDLGPRRKTDRIGDRIKLCRCGASKTMPRSESTAPGAPMLTARTARILTPARSTACSTTFAISAISLSGFSFGFVGCLSSPST